MSFSYIFTTILVNICPTDNFPPRRTFKLLSLAVPCFSVVVNFVDYIYRSTQSQFVTDISHFPIIYRKCFYMLQEFDGLERNNRPVSH